MDARKTKHILKRIDISPGSRYLPTTQTGYGSLPALLISSVNAPKVRIPLSTNVQMNPDSRNVGQCIIENANGLATGVDRRPGGVQVPCVSQYPQAASTRFSANAVKVSLLDSRSVHSNSTSVP